MEWILRYLAGTTHIGIYIRRIKDLSLSVYCYANLAESKVDCKSTSRYAIYAGLNLVSSSLKKQHVVSGSSTQAEYRSLATSTSEVLWFISILKEIGLFPSRPPKLWCEWHLTGNPIFHSLSRHLKIEFHFFFFNILLIRINCLYTIFCLKIILAYFLTKLFPKAKFTAI